MRTTKRLALLKGRRVRVTRLDACGRPVYGDDAQVVTKGFITATFSAQLGEIAEVRVENAAGETCVLEPAQQTVEGLSLEIQFCDVDPDLFALMTGVGVLLNAQGVAVGFEQTTDIDMTSFGFAFELWTGIVSDAGCGEVGDTPYGYMLLPFLKGGVLGDFTVENGALNFTITGATTRNGNAWGAGPYYVDQDIAGNAAQLFTDVAPNASYRLMETLVAPPESVAGSRPLLDTEHTNLTAVTGTVTAGSLSVPFSVTPDTVAGESVWYDFGDGEWDYVTTLGGDETHIYAQAGTYTVKASANGKFVTTTVTVTSA